MAIRLVHVPRSAWSRLSASVKSASSALPSWTATARRRRCRSLQATTSCSARPSTTTSRKCRYSASRTRKVSGSEAWRTGGASNPVIATPCRCNSVSNLRAASGAGGVKAVAGAKDCMGAQGGGRAAVSAHESFRTVRLEFTRTFCPSPGGVNSKSPRYTEY